MNISQQVEDKHWLSPHDVILTAATSWSAIVKACCCLCRIIKSPHTMRGNKMRKKIWIIQTSRNLTEQGMIARHSIRTLQDEDNDSLNRIIIIAQHSHRTTDGSYKWGVLIRKGLLFHNIVISRDWLRVLSRLLLSFFKSYKSAAWGRGGSVEDLYHDK